MTLEPLEKRRSRGRYRVDGATRLQNDRGKAGKRNRFMREAEEAIVRRGYAGAVERIPTASG